MKNTILILFAVFFVAVDSTIYICLPHNATMDHNEIIPKLQSIVGEVLEETVKGSISIDHLGFDFKHPAISANGTFDNLTILNFLDYNISFTNSLSPLVIEITFNNISMDGQYDLFGNIGELFDVFGKGDVWLNMIGFTVTVEVDLFWCAIDIFVKLQQCQNNFANFMFDRELGDLLNKVIADLIPDIVEEMWEELKEAGDGPLQDYIDSILQESMRRLSKALEKL